MKEFFVRLSKNEKLKIFLENNRDMMVRVAAAALLVVAAFFVFTLSATEEKVAIEEETVSVEETADRPSVIYVDIGGEVVEPMVAELEEGSRVEDAIKAAGGCTENADLTDINRAAFVEDGEKIYIPSIAEDVSSDANGAMVAASVGDDRININTADADQLEQLDGIGPVTAEKIIAYREEYGRFLSIEDIKNVSGIGEKTYEKFKDDIKT